MAVLLLTHVLLIGGARSATFPADKAALLEFKGTLTYESNMLENWTDGSDPCDDGWTGIRCNCSDFFERNTTKVSL